jgi:nitrite reductase/ring-hydroxylating ferredoxin subunit
MKKYILLFLLIGFLTGCDSDNLNNNNRYLANYNFQVKVDMDLPLYNQLKFTGNSKLITISGAGINGVIVTNTGTGYTAYEASCPNQPLTACSVLTINDIIATCPCDNVEYFLYTGAAQGIKVEYPLKPYRIQQISENILMISN